MSKILIPLNNSAGGVIVRQIAADEYEHVLSFENETVKKQFIGKELFNDINFDYTVEIDNQPEFTIMRSSATSASVRISLSKMNENTTGLKYTMNDLLNVDCLFLKEDGITQLYSVESATKLQRQNNDTVTLTLALDVMFNVIDEIDLQGEVYIERAHTIRHNGVAYLKDYNITPESQYNEFSPNILSSKSDIVTNNPLYEDAKDVTGCLVAVSTKEGEGGMKYGRHGGLNQDNGYEMYEVPGKLFIFPINFEVGGPVRHAARGINGTGKAGGTLSLKNGRDDANILSIDYIKGGGPFKGDVLEEVIYEPGAERGNYYFNATYTDMNGREIDGLAWYDTNKAFEIKDGSALTRQVQMKLEDVNLFTQPVLTSFEEPRNILNETKLYTSQFTKYTMESKGMEEPFEIEREYLGTGEILENPVIRQKMAYLPKKGANLYTITNYELNDLNETNQGLVDKFKQLPGESNAYNKGVSENAFSSSMNHTTAMGMKGIAAGAVAGSVVPGVGTAAGAAAGGIAAFGGAAFSKMSTKADLRHRPNKVENMDYNFSADQNTRMNPCIKKYELQKNIKEYIFDRLTKEGYTIGIIDDLSNGTNNRYYYNYIKTGNVFSLIKNRYSAEIKNIINDTFRQGFTIGHVRDVNTFKGIANYTYENQEMTLIAK